MTMPLILMFLGGVMFVGFLASELFEKTKVPDSIILILIGILLKSQGLVDPAMLAPLTPIVASIAIALILFESGMSINLGELASSLSGAFNLANISFILNSLAIGGLTILFTGWDPLTSLLVGFMLGGTSAAVVIPIARKLLPPDVAPVVELESTITNVYNFVFAMSVANIIESAQVSATFALNSLLSYFSIGALVGIVGGFIWISFAQKLWRKHFSYMVTLSTLFILYGFSELAGGSGAVAGLVFGLVLGNNKEISEIAKTPAVGTRGFLKFSQEMAFLIRTYFFLFIGSVLNVPYDMLLWSLAVSIAVAAFLLRAVTAKLLSLPTDVALLIPRGLSEVVIASIIMGMGLPHAEGILTIAGLVIIVTNLLPSIIMNWRKYSEHGNTKQKSKG
jgi:NhaP-type Na+/H+ or K+/H+ antiporter